MEESILRDVSPEWLEAAKDYARRHAEMCDEIQKISDEISGGIDG